MTAEYPHHNVPSRTALIIQEGLPLRSGLIGSASVAF